MFIPRRRHGLQITIWTAIAVVALAAGFAIAQFRTALVDAPILRQPRTPGGNLRFCDWTKRSQPIPLASIYLDSYCLNHQLQIISKCRALPLWAQPV